MIADMKRIVVELDYRGILPVQGAVGTGIGCLRGRVWITERGCPGDIVLESGESYESLGSGDVLVQALRESLVAVSAPQAIRPGACHRSRGSGFRELVAGCRPLAQSAAR